MYVYIYISSAKILIFWYTHTPMVLTSLYCFRFIQLPVVSSTRPALRQLLRTCISWKKASTNGGCRQLAWKRICCFLFIGRTWKACWKLVNIHDMGVSKNMGYPKKDGENNGKPYFLMDDLGGFSPLFSETSISDILIFMRTEVPAPASVLVSEFWGAVCQIVYPFSFHLWTMNLINLPFHAPP